MGKTGTCVAATTNEPKFEVNSLVASLFHGSLATVCLCSSCDIHTVSAKEYLCFGFLFYFCVPVTALVFV